MTATAAVFYEEVAGMVALDRFSFGDYDLSVEAASDGIWAFVTKEQQGVALRLTYPFGARFQHRLDRTGDSKVTINLTTTLGNFRSHLELFVTEDSLLLRSKTLFKPSKDIALTHWPRDLYMLGAGRDPSKVDGVVHAAQRGLNAGILFASLEGRFGTLLYYQNFSSLADYFEAIGKAPDSAVGGQWPEFGYQAPTDIDKPLQAGKEIVLLDTFIALTRADCDEPTDMSRVFLQLLACIYKNLDRPGSAIHDWPARAKSTLRSLKSPKALRRDFGQLYLRPYVQAEYPDSMVQLSVISALQGYEDWRHREVPMKSELIKGVSRFYDKDLGVVRRYLPNVGGDKDADEVDSWYLYHPLKSLGHLASAGHEWARKLFFKSIEFGIDAAHRFNYDWPVTYNLRNFKITKGARKPGEPGQSDVGGIYAYVMLQAHELSGDERYLIEAEKAIAALEHRRFDLLYQANLSAFGAAACTWLWQLTHKDFYLSQACVFVSNLLHNSVIWKSKLGAAKYFETFMGVTCLHDAPYLAAYECFEVYAGLREMLQRGGEHLSEPVRLLAVESTRFAVVTGICFYPDVLPEDTIAKEFRNGTVDRKLSLPLEDLYVDGQPAGSVGQEVYGAGAAFLYCIYSHLQLSGNRGWIASDYPIMNLKEENGTARFAVLGSNAVECLVKYVPGPKGSGEASILGGTKISNNLWQVPGGSRVVMELPRKS